MKIIHRIGINPDDKQRQILENLGIQIPKSENPYSGSVTFDLDEDSGEYKKIEPFITLWRLFDATGTIFTDAEINSADFLILISPWTNGYPMPDNDGGYKHTTFNNENYCKKCGGGLTQKDSFRLKKEPNWGNKKIFSLNWVYDEFFARKDFYEDVLMAYGLEAQPVLLYKKDTVIESTIQLKIPVTNSPLLLDGLSYITCEVCNRKRYDLINRGFFPPFLQNVKTLHLFKSKENFGTGGNTRKYVFISQALRLEFIRNKIKANYIPCLEP